MTAGASILGGNDPVSRALGNRLPGAVLPWAAPLPAGLSGLVAVMASSQGTAGLHEVDWNRLVEAPLRLTLDALRRGRERMIGRGGRIVLVLPTVGVSGAPRLVAQSTTVEGVRAMAKSAARQWASDGITVNMIGVPLCAFGTESADPLSHVTAPAVAADDGLLDTVVEAARFLLQPNITHLTGETILVDGGSLMRP